MISQEPEITAMQITAEEDFMIIASSGIFEKLQSIDLMNIVWQQSLMEAAKQKPGEEITVNTGLLVDTLIKLASFKRQVNSENEKANEGTRPSFTLILILFKSFKDKLLKYLQKSKIKNTQYFGMLRSETVDEIELEPIDSNFETDQDHLNEGYDEILYRQDVDYPRGVAAVGRGLGIKGAYKRT